MAALASSSHFFHWLKWYSPSLRPLTHVKTSSLNSALSTMFLSIIALLNALISLRNLSLESSPCRCPCFLLYELNTHSSRYSGNSGASGTLNFFLEFRAI